MAHLTDQQIAEEIANKITDNNNREIDSDRLFEVLTDINESKANKSVTDDLQTQIDGIGGGGGSVESVNNVLPDVNGNITLTKEDIGLGNVDNTADILKPLSTHVKNYIYRTLKSFRNIITGANPLRYMFFATRNSVIYGGLRVAPAETTYVMTKLVFGTPEYETNDYRLHYSGFSINGGAAPREDVLPGNDQNIYGVWISNDGGITKKRAQFNAVDGVVIPSASEGFWTDSTILDKDTPGDGSITVFTLYYTAVGQNQLTNYRVQTHRGERVWGANDAETLLTYLDNPNVDSDSRLYTDWSKSFTEYGQAQSSYYGPDNMVSKGWDGRPVALVAADSIGESRQEYAISADDRGNLGWLRRWLDKADPIYGRIPHFIIGMPGVTSARELIANSIKRWNIVDSIRAFNNGQDAWTVIINQVANNDIANPPFNAASNNMTAFATRIRTRYPGCKIIGIPPLVQSSSIDSWSTSAGQTLSFANHTPPDGTRYQVIDAIIAGTNYNDGFIDNRNVFNDPIEVGKWKTGLLDVVLQNSIGTDGIETYDYITVDRTDCMPGDTFVYTPLNQIFTVRFVNGNVLALVASRAFVIQAGTVLKCQSSTDGIHPSPRMCFYAANNVPQSQKEKLLSSSSYPAFALDTLKKIVDVLSTKLDSSGVTALIDIAVPPAIETGIATAKADPNGIASLVGGLVPIFQLPSYVDDVLEYADFSAFPAIGETGKIYIALDTSHQYRWTGTVYFDLTAGNVSAVVSTDNAIVRFDGVGGQVQNSSSILDDNGNLTTGTLSPSSSSIPQNGFYQPSSNTIGISTNGVGKLTVDSIGRMTLGLSSLASTFTINTNANTVLDLKSSGGGISINLNQISGTNYQFYSSSGNFGVYNVTLGYTPFAINGISSACSMRIVSGGVIGFSSSSTNATFGADCAMSRVSSGVFAFGSGVFGNTTAELRAGNFKAMQEGNGFFIKEGANAKMGQSSLVAGNILVNNTSVNANSRIHLTRVTPGGTLGHLSYSQINGVSFTINSDSAMDTSLINWVILEAV